MKGVDQERPGTRFAALTVGSRGFVNLILVQCFPVSFSSGRAGSRHLAEMVRMMRSPLTAFQSMR
jgi:hypothetical protein